MHGHDQGHGRFLRSKSVLHAVFAKTVAALVQATQLELSEEVRPRLAASFIARSWRAKTPTHLKPQPSGPIAGRRRFCDRKLERCLICSTPRNVASPRHRRRRIGSTGLAQEARTVRWVLKGTFETNPRKWCVGARGVFNSSFEQGETHEQNHSSQCSDWRCRGLSCERSGVRWGPRRGASRGTVSPKRHH